MTTADTLVPVDAVEDPASLGRDLARAYKQAAAFYRDQLELLGPEADRRARGLDGTEEEAAADLQRIMERPADQVGWFDLTRLAERNPDDLAAAWRRIRIEAQQELASGHRTAHALEWRGGPWQRAQYLALRASFRDGTPPGSGIESALVDSAAEAFSDYLEWSEHAHMLQSTEVESQRTRVERDGDWSPMRLSYAEALEQAVRMAGQAHKRFLQTVKLLHDLQRTSATVFVGSAGQINVSEKQINMQAAPSRARTRRTDLPKSSGGSRRRRKIVPTRQAGAEG
jgi:hypothetical protein